MSSRSLSLVALLLTRGSDAARYHALPYQARALAGREAQVSFPEPGLSNLTTTAQCPVPTVPAVLGTVLPSPDADPVEVTSQSQVVTSYEPAMTWCVGPPLGLIPTATITNTLYDNATTLFGTVSPGTSTCDTVYVPTATTVCATVLTGLASKITVTDCSQKVTFSSECGFDIQTPTPTLASNLSMITPPPVVDRLTTFWMAPWQSLTDGSIPTDVDMKVCTVVDETQLACQHFEEVWEVVVTTQTFITTRTISLETTLTGPGTLVVETLRALVTDTVAYVNLTTTFHLETEVETESVVKSRKLVSRPADATTTVRATSTQYITKVVKYKSPALPTLPATIETPSLTLSSTSLPTSLPTLTLSAPISPPSATLPTFKPSFSLPFSLSLPEVQAPSSPAAPPTVASQSLPTIPMNITTPKVQTPSVELPTFATPAIKAPGIPSSLLTTPTIETPAIETSTIETPTIETPAIESLTIETPTIKTPTIATPTIATPTIETSAADAPTVELPTIKTPTIAAPSIATPSIEVPSLGSPSIEPPSAVATSIATSSVRTPVLSLTLPTRALSTTIGLTSLASPLASVLARSEPRLRPARHVEPEV